MINLRANKVNCYCAFCRTPRKAYRKKSISTVNVLGSLMASVVIMFAMWQEFDPRFLFIFVICLAISEVFLKIRWRMNIVCPTCGFDPVLYLKDHQAAVQKVKFQLQVREQDPMTLLKKPLDLPVLSAERAVALENKDKKGQLVSRQV